MADDLGDDDYFLDEVKETKTIENFESIKEDKKPNKKKSPLKRSFGNYSDLINTFRVHYKKSKSEFELDEIMSKFSSKTSAPSPSRSSLPLNEYLNELVPETQWLKKSELKSAPIVLIVAQSALRCIELGKLLKNSSSSKLMTFHYLFAKHKKLSEQIDHLRQKKTFFNIIIGTPKRIDDILDDDVIDFKRFKYVLIDWNYQNIKQQRLVDLNQLKTELCHLLCEQKFLSKRFLKEKTQLGLF